MKSKLTTLIFVLLSVWRMSAQVTATLTQPTGCEANGIIELVDIQGEAPFTIDWTQLVNGNGSSAAPDEIPLDQWNNQTKISELSPGQYCVTVKDAKCCEARYCFSLESSNGSIKVSYKKNTEFCVILDTKPLPGSCIGIIEIAVENPSQWSFSWTMKGASYKMWNTQNIYDLCTGTYILTAINEELGCKETLEVDICCCDAAGKHDEDTGVLTRTNSKSVVCCHRRPQRLFR